MKDTFLTMLAASFRYSLRTSLVMTRIFSCSSSPSLCPSNRSAKSASAIQHGHTMLHILRDRLANRQFLTKPKIELAITESLAKLIIFLAESRVEPAVVLVEPKSSSSPRTLNSSSRFSDAASRPRSTLKLRLSSSAKSRPESAPNWLSESSSSV